MIEVERASIERKGGIFSLYLTYLVPSDDAIFARGLILRRRFDVLFAPWHVGANQGAGDAVEKLVLGSLEDCGWDVGELDARDPVA